MATSMYLFFGLASFLLVLAGKVNSNNVSVNCSDVEVADTNSSNTRISLSEVFEQCLREYQPYHDCPDPTLCTAGEPDGVNIALAFGLTIGAGLATTLGALIPFIPFIRRTDTKYLAAALGLAAGVMIYVSFTEILSKSRGYLCCLTVDHYDVVTTSCFFVGILLTICLDIVVYFLGRIDCGCSFSRFKEMCSCLKSQQTSAVNVTQQDISLNASNNDQQGQLTNQTMTNGNTSHLNHSDQGSLLENNNSDSAFDRNSVPSSNNSPSLLHNNVDLSLPDNDVQTERR